MRSFHDVTAHDAFKVSLSIYLAVWRETLTINLTSGTNDER